MRTPKHPHTSSCILLDHQALVQILHLPKWARSSDKQMLVVPRHIWGTTSNKPHISCRFCQLRAPTGPNANLCNSCQCLEIPTCYKHPLGEARGSLILPSFLTATLGCLFLHAPCRARFSCRQSLGNSAQVPDFLKKASPSVPWTLSTNSVSTSGHLALSYSTWKKAVDMHMFS